jgi:hypothetical protein
VFVGTIGKAGEPYAVLEDIKGCYYGSVRPALLLSSCNVSGSTAEASGGEWEPRVRLAITATAAAAAVCHDDDVITSGVVKASHTAHM